MLFISHLQSEHCVTAVCVHGDRILAGSEDGCVSIFDLRSSAAVMRLQSEWREDVNALRPLNEGEQVLAIGNRLCVLDLRQPEIRLAQTHTDAGGDPLEIHGLGVTPNGRCMAVADDSGELLCYDVDAAEFKPRRRLPNAHTNMAVGVAFLSGRPWECVSVGMDGRLKCWDTSRRRLLAEVDFMSVQEQSGSGGQPMVNPPLCFGVDVAPVDRQVAVALGDGSVALLSKPADKSAAKRLDRWPRRRLEHGHCSAVCKVLISGGNDGAICVWSTDDPSADHCETKPLDVYQLPEGASVNDIAALPDRNMIVADHLTTSLHVLRLQ